MLLANSACRVTSVPMTGLWSWGPTFCMGWVSMSMRPGGPGEIPAETVWVTRNSPSGHPSLSTRPLPANSWEGEDRLRPGAVDRFSAARLDAGGGGEPHRRHGGHAGVNACASRGDTRARHVPRGGAGVGPAADAGPNPALVYAVEHRSGGARWQWIRVLRGVAWGDRPGRRCRVSRGCQRRRRTAASIGVQVRSTNVMTWPPSARPAGLAAVLTRRRAADASQPGSGS